MSELRGNMSCNDLRAEEENKRSKNFSTYIATFPGIDHYEKNIISKLGIDCPFMTKYGLPRFLSFINQNQAENRNLY